MRIGLERVFRAIALIALAALLWESVRDQTNPRRELVRARGAEEAQLSKWTRTAAAPASISLGLDSVPSPRQRAWLGALAAAGTDVDWRGDLSPLMMGATPVTAPAGGTRLTVAAPSGSSIVVTDEIGPIDTVKVENGGAVLSTDANATEFSARAKGSVAYAFAGDSVLLRKVLVVADASWESKFVVAALEEAGWKVDAMLRVAPTVSSTQGSIASIDTSRYSAVVALDAAGAAYANRIVEFARMGGGVVLGPAAASLDGLATLRAGAPGRVPAETRANQSSGLVSLGTLPVTPIAPLRPDAIALERRGSATTVAARRFGAGRSLQLGYQDTWRWRLGGDDKSIAEHREWWTKLVSSVAHAPAFSRRSGLATDSRKAGDNSAPLADLVGAVGPPTGETRLAGLAATGFNWVALLFALLVLSLLAETGSRRLRGAS